MINLFKFRVELDGSHLIYQVYDLREVQEYKAKVPRKRIRGAYDMPCPDRIEHET